MPQSHSFAFDPEFLQVAGPTLAAIAQLPKHQAHDIEGQRASFGGILASIAQQAPQLDVTNTTHQIKTRDGASIDVIQVSPKQRQGNGAAVLYIHGGGYVSATAKHYVDAAIVGGYAAHSGIDFFAVDYRLAPENHGDGLVNDCYDALQWLSTNAASLNIDNKRIGVMGDSAGGGLAAGVALQARDTGFSPPLRKQILIYPMLDDRNLKRTSDLRQPLSGPTMQMSLDGQECSARA